MRSRAREGRRRSGKPSAMKSPSFQSIRKTASISRCRSGSIIARVAIPEPRHATHW
jgi:hypothetical protein